MNSELQGAILVVDDEPSVLTFVSLLLKPLGFTVLVAPSGPRALEICKQHSSNLQLLVTDVNMVPMNGVEVAHAIRRMRPDIRTLYITGYTAAEQMVSQEVTQGLARFLAKPFSPAAFAKTVAELLI